MAGDGGRGANDVLNTPIGQVVFDTTGTYMYVDDDFDYRVRRYGLRTYYTPSVAGSYTATYTSALGCVSGVSDTVTVYAPPVVTLSWDSLVQQTGLLYTQPPYSKAYFCTNDGIYGFALSGGIPSGGSYSGLYIVNDSLSIPSPLQALDTIYYIYTNSNGCMGRAMDSLFLDICEGINPISGGATISLYPNPNNGSFVLQSSDAVGKEYIISDMLGRVVAEQTINSNNQDITLQNISSGSYMLSVKGNNSRAVRFAVE